MHIELAWDTENRIIRANVSGAFDAPVFASHLKAFLDATDIPSNADALWDFRRLDFSTLTLEQLDRYVEHRTALEAYRAGCHAAFVVEGNMQHIAMRLFDLRSDGLRQTRRIFDDMETAERWLLEQAR